MVSEAVSDKPVNVAVGEVVNDKLLVDQPADTQTLVLSQDIDQSVKIAESSAEIKVLKHKVAKYECLDDVRVAMNDKGGIMKATGILTKLGGMPDISKALGYSNSIETVFSKLTGEKKDRFETCMRRKNKERQAESLQSDNIRSVLVSRKRGSGMKARKIKLIIDGKVVETLRGGEKVMLHLSPEATILRVKVGSISTKPFNLSSIKDGDSLQISLKELAFGIFEAPFRIKKIHPNK
jgi:hypothetical protein